MSVSTPRQWHGMHVLHLGLMGEGVPVSCIELHWLNNIASRTGRWRLQRKLWCHTWFAGRGVGIPGGTLCSLQREHGWEVEVGRRAGGRSAAEPVATACLGLSLAQAGECAATLARSEGVPPPQMTYDAMLSLLSLPQSARETLGLLSCSQKNWRRAAQRLALSALRGLGRP